MFRWKKIIYFWGSVCAFLRVTLLKMIVLSRFLGKQWNIKDLIQAVGLSYFFYCFFWRYSKKKKKLQKGPVNWSFSELFFFIPPWASCRPNLEITSSLQTQMLSSVGTIIAIDVHVKLNILPQHISPLPVWI